MTFADLIASRQAATDRDLLETFRVPQRVKILLVLLLLVADFYVLWRQLQLINLCLCLGGEQRPYDFLVFGALRLLLVNVPVGHQRKDHKLAHVIYMVPLDVNDFKSRPKIQIFHHIAHRFLVCAAASLWKLAILEL